MLTSHETKTTKTTAPVVWPKRISKTEVTATKSIRVSQTTLKFLRRNGTKNETHDQTLRRLLGLTKENLGVPTKAPKLDS